MDQRLRERVEGLAGEHGRSVLAAAQRVLGDPDEAEDVLQQVFLRLLENGIRSEPENWGAFLRVMATHAAIDRLRQARRFQTEEPDLLEHRVRSSLPSPDEAVERRRLAELLRQALARLPRREAEAFVLKHFEDLTHAAIARHQGGTANQVGVMLHRARKKLRQILEPLLAPAPARKD